MEKINILNKEQDWKLTDPSCNQYGRKLSDKVFEFKEDRIIDPLSKETELYTSVINISDYSQQEIESTLMAFGYDTKDTIEDWIIAECLFELET
jgi:predicted house-cleaning noncanonical NTP pyrophosphatase (MazG superfamily)